MPETVVGSTVPRRQLGRELRRLREQEARIPQVDAARALEWSVTKLWRLEGGELAVRALDVKAMCELYGADEQTTVALTAIAPHTKSKGWWHDYADIPPWFELFIGLEEAASKLREYHTDLVSGVLQTREYATAVFSKNARHVATEEVERRVAVRMKRARLLTRLDPAAASFDIVLEESVLRRRVGSQRIMAGQLRRLAEAGELPNVSIRVLPLGAALHAGALVGGSFTILDFPRREEPTTIYVEGLTGALYLDKQSEAEGYVWAFGDLSSAALDEASSRDLFWTIAREFDQ
ncbi:helix-turn-helix protein [Micromonospora pisi]|uniref:Helix-turn-helix protein n=1 Tax=Micromonospora pisi TaxID=589240 RepID=A0A495JIQ7_9ACTN|nr:helix-turn-helix transcriptional regulator [Micromonospora pisi]RKR88950.1 helix-turn-helix protein [Micromonospora pisi]